MTKTKMAGAMMAILLLPGSTVFAEGHGGGGGGTAPASGGGGGGTHASSGGGGAPRGGFNGAGPHYTISPRYYSPISNYRPTTTYGNGYRTFNYPAVRGTMVPIHGSINGTNHISGTQSARVHHNLTSQNHQIANGHTPTDAQVGKWSHNNRVGRSKLDPQTASQLRHWNGKIDSAAEARRNHQDFRFAHHNRDWWRHHCAAIIFFDWGWWGWYDGWWYPAWGYDPYAYYAYDQPIYGYNGLPPDQVIADVQAALQQQGYFQYAVDGNMGPLTRAAIANYQRDHLLPITGEIDPPTLGSLGLAE